MVDLIFFIDDKFGEIYLYDPNNLKYMQPSKVLTNATTIKTLG